MDGADAVHFGNPPPSPTQMNARRDHEQPVEPISPTLDITRESWLAGHSAGAWKAAQGDPTRAAREEEVAEEIDRSEVESMRREL